MVVTILGSTLMEQDKRHTITPAQMDIMGHSLHGKGQQVKRAISQEDLSRRARQLL